jgi:hypothetical protein
MKIPSLLAERIDFYSEVIKDCLSSRDRRLEAYALNRRYYLFGSNDEGMVSPWNKIYSHIDLVTSMLYASDSTRFVTHLESGAPKGDYKKTHSFTKRVEEAWHDANTDYICEQAVRWSLVYDSMFVKFIRKNSELHPFLVDPGSMGVYREDVPMLDRQEAFVHVYYATLSDLRRRISLHPNRDRIIRDASPIGIRKDIATEMPAILDRIVAANQYPLSSPTMIGEANISLSGAGFNDYKASISVPMVEMKELWVWDDLTEDWQTVTIEGDANIIYDQINIFMKRTKEFSPEHGFVQFCPSPQYDYFWGISEVSRLIRLQEKRNERMNDIQIQLKKMVYPPVGISGTGALEDKIEALMDPKGIVSLGDPSTKVERFEVQIPRDVYEDIKQLDAMFDEMSGLTNVTQGRGEPGVRSAGHAGKLASLGSTRPKKRALVIEDSLEKAATITGRHIFVDDDDKLEDDDGHPYIAAQMTPKFRIGIDAHSNSPVFAENSKEDAQVLLKAKALTRKRFIEMIAPPMVDEIIRDLETEIIPEEKAAAEQKQQVEMAKFQQQNPNQPKGQIVPMKGG